MKLSFQIQPISINTTSASLFIEINAQGLTYIILDNNICVALVIYHFNTGTSAEIAAGYIHKIIADQPVLQQKFNKVHIIYGYAPSILVPHRFIDEMNKNAMIELVYGNSGERVTKSDFMYRHAIHNVYGIPLVIEQAVIRYFGSAENTHIFSLLPDVIKDMENHLYCIFNKEQLTVLLLKKGRLQLMQNFSYKTPEDVAYRLLILCNSFGVEVNDTKVNLSGMIDANSALYEELNKYFLQLQFGALPDQYHYPEDINELPAHYFSHLFAIASCV